MADEKPVLKSTQFIAKIFGVSTRRVEQLKTEGIIKGQGKPTRYDYDQTMMDYIKYLSDKANGREKKEAVADLEERKLKAEVDTKQAKAEISSLELDELRGKLHRAEDVEAITTDHVLYFRSMLMALPGKLAVDCANCKTAAEAAERIQREVYFILDSLAEYRYDQEEYKKRVRERQGWESEQRGDADDEK